MVEGCERCDGAGCRYCSGRGWVDRVLPTIPACRKRYPPVTIEDIDSMADWHKSSPPASGGPLGGTKKDTEVRGREDEPDEREPHINTVLNDWDDEPTHEPDEAVRITTEYPDARVKLIKVRYGTLAKALAEAFNGRPW